MDEKLPELPDKAEELEDRLNVEEYYINRKDFEKYLRERNSFKKIAIGFLSETFIVLSLLSYAMLILQDINRVLATETWSDWTLWIDVLRSMGRNGIVLLSGIVGHVADKYRKKESEKKDLEAKELADKKALEAKDRETVTQNLAANYVKLQAACLASPDERLRDAGRNTALDLIGKGVDLFNILSVDSPKKIEIKEINKEQVK